MEHEMETGATLCIIGLETGKVPNLWSPFGFSADPSPLKLDP